MGLLAASALVSGVTLLSGAPPVQAAPAPSSVAIGVDHFDPVNTQPRMGKIFEYTDFFTRNVTVHRGEVVNFQTSPFAFHIVALAQDEGVARHVYPVTFNDRSDANAPSGAPKIGLGSSNFPITGGSTTHPLSGHIDFTRGNGPPVCGATGEADCVFKGGNDVEVAGPNISFTSAPADWRIKINAEPGTYHFFCYIHPHMSGTLHVVESGEPVTTQAQIDRASAQQFFDSQARAERAEFAANQVEHSDAAPGHRTYSVKVGISAADNHVAIDEMFPNPQTVPGGIPALTRGDRVVYLWRDDHNVHSVFFPAHPPHFRNSISPFGFDCDSGFVPFGGGPPCRETNEPGPTSPPFNPPFEVIGDPGNATAGSLLINQKQTLDAGVRTGEDYGLRPSSQSWSLVTDAVTAAGPQPYLFHCTVHDFMVGGFTVNP
jgi:plastocyanin